MSLIDEVMGVSMESSYNNNYYKGLNDPIDDTAESMLYASQECMVGIVAVEAAIATMEGQTAVAIMKTNDSYEKQRLVSTYEGFISDAWEKIKEWIRKAYETVKRWLQKVWNKIKQGADMVKAFFTKYGSVLREKDTSGLEVKWCEITLDGANSVIKAEMSDLNTAETDIKRIISANADVDSITDNVKAKIARTHDFREMCISAIYTGPKGQEAEDKEFVGAIKNQALEAADIGSTQKLVSEYMKLGDDGNNDAIKYINEMMKENNKNNKTTGSDAKDIHNTTNILRTLTNQILRAKLQVYNIAATTTLEAAKRLRSQSIAACRKAIFHNTEESYTPNNYKYSNSMESTSQLNNILANIMI